LPQLAIANRGAVSILPGQSIRGLVGAGNVSRLVLDPQARRLEAETRSQIIRSSEGCDAKAPASGLLHRTVEPRNKLGEAGIFETQLPSRQIAVEEAPVAQEGVLEVAREGPA
jgi:hypothetical protein